MAKRLQREEHINHKAFMFWLDETTHESADVLLTRAAHKYSGRSNRDFPTDALDDDPTR